MNIEEERRSAIVQAYTEMARHPVYLDVETTGLERHDEIIEICVLESDGSVLFESLVKPRGRISQEAYWAHRITKRMVQDAPTWDQVLPNVKRALEGRRIAAFNAEFDSRLLRQTNALYDLSSEFNAQRFVCVMKLYARFYGRLEPGGQDYRWQRLPSAARQCGIEHGTLHRAQEDAQLSRALLKHMASFYIVQPPKVIFLSRPSLLQRWLARIRGL